MNNNFNVGDTVVIRPPDGKHKCEEIVKHWQGSVCNVSAVYNGRYKLEFIDEIVNDSKCLYNRLSDYIWDADEIEPYTQATVSYDENDIIALLRDE